MALFTLPQLARDITASGKNGDTTYTFIARYKDGQYQAFARPEDCGGIVLSRATNGMDAASRHSKTLVEVDLNPGDVIKTVVKDLKRGGSTSLEIVGDDGELANLTYIGARKADGMWETVAELSDGSRLYLPG